MRENIILSVDFEGADLTTKKSLTLSKTIHELGIEKKRLAQEIKKLDTSSKTYEQDLSKLIGRQNQVSSQLKVVKKDYADNERAVINNTRANRALDGSLEQQRAKLAVLQQQWVKMSATQRTSSVEGKKLKSQIDQLDASVKGNEQSIGIHSRSVGNYGQAIQGLTPMMGQFGMQISMIQSTLSQLKTALGGTAIAQKGVAVATGGTNKALKLFRIALISTGIGAIVVAFGSLLAALLSTQKGMDAMNRITTYVGEVFGTLFGVLQDVGVPIWEALKNAFTIYVNNFKLGYLLVVQGVQEMRIAWNEFTGDSEEADKLRVELDKTKKKIKEVVDETKKATKDIADAAKEAADIVGETDERLAAADARSDQISDLEEEIALMEISQKKKEALFQLEIESQRKIRKNKSLGDAERRKAEAKEIEATRQLRQLEIDLIDKKREKAILETKANDTDNEAKKEIADLEADALQKQAQLQKDITRITQEGNSERKKERADALKSIEEEKKKKIESEKEALEQKEKLLELERKLTIASTEETAEERYQNEVALQEELYNLRLEKSKLSNEDTLILEKEHALTLAELKKEELARLSGIEEEERLKQETAEAERLKQEQAEAVMQDLTEEERRKKWREAGIESAKIVADSVLANQSRRLDQGTKREIEALNLRKQAGEITEEEFEKKREEIDRKAFKKKKSIDTKQVLINSLVAAAKIYAQVGVLSPPAVALLGVQTAAQVAGIQSQTFADGGFTGLSSSKPDHTGEKPVGVVHESEFVASKRTLGTPLGIDMANKLNQINKNPSLGYYANGGFTSTTQQIGTDGIERAISQSLTNMKVINVATDTSKVDARVKKIQNKGRI